ncbi:caM kinase-like vesicle-associated protein isoform 2-T2 [Liasis olivaceus]
MAARAPTSHPPKRLLCPSISLDKEQTGACLQAHAARRGVSSNTLNSSPADGGEKPGESAPRRMPFGCIGLRDEKNYNSLSDITDKYEIGQLLRAVNHPNILQLIDTFETRKEFYIIQELATGGDVFDWILDQGYYTEKDASNVVRQVLEALAYLHNLHIVHRNLKLENLMYYNQNNRSKVVLRDFYLSRFENGAITEPCGTPEYLAPEVVARQRYGRPVDCWAVGVIMFILLSGNPPFYDDTDDENSDSHNRRIFRKILAGDYDFDSPYWDDISLAAKKLVSRLMEVDQDQRITAQEALGHIWISGNIASEKNLKEGVCAQIEKNFAKAKWRKAIRVTTFMQRLRATDVSGRLPVTPRTSMSMAHEVTIEAPRLAEPLETPCSLEEPQSKREAAVEQRE